MKQSTNPEVVTEPISIFTYVCAKFHDSIPLLAKRYLFQKNKLLATRGCAKFVPLISGV